jgi:hypothetical protein
MPDYKFYIETISKLLQSDDYKPSQYVDAKGKQAEEALHRIYIEMQNDMHRKSGKLQEIVTEVLTEKKACWKGYKQIGMKEKNGKQVPNCVPIKKK